MMWHKSWLAALRSSWRLVVGPATSTRKSVGRRARFAPLLEALEERAVPARIGYYDMGLGEGNSAQVEPITRVGHTAVDIFDLSASELAGIDVLMVQNPNDSGYGQE